MPSCWTVTPNGKQRSSLTNIISANDLLLLPRFNTDSEAFIQNAKQTYSRLMPASVVETVDLSSMKALQSALHCLSINLPSFAPYPQGRYTYAAFREQLE